MTDSNSSWHGLQSGDLTSQYTADPHAGDESSLRTPRARALQVLHGSDQDFSTGLFPHFTESELPTHLRWASEPDDGPEVQKAPVLQFGFLVWNLRQRILERAETLNPDGLAYWSDLRRSPDDGEAMFISAAWSILVDDIHRSVPWLRVMRCYPIGPDDGDYSVVTLYSNERSEENRMRLAVLNLNKRASMKAAIKAIKGTLGLPEDTVPLWYFDQTNRIYDRSFNANDWCPWKSQQGGTRDSAQVTPVAQKVDE
ncbi:hypothetical protein C8Q79DRAFT_1009683 [Trametes meyenii]|nr:hypothetical protein C8Q79DRAFT_1009683 [Trametes meyenii]